MKLLYSLIATIFFISSSIVNGQSCQQFLSTLNDPSKCYQISISGVHRDSLAQEGFKGNLVYSNGELVPKESLINLQTYETICNKEGLIQPFYAGAKFLIDDFSISVRDSNVRLKQINTQLTCSQPDFANFRLNNFYYSIVIKAYDQCPKLNYGEQCNTPTVTPTTTPTTTPKPTVTPTSTPTTKPTNPPTGSNAIKYQTYVDNQWNTNGVQFYQYRVVLTNNESTAIKAIEINSNNWNPTEIWNIEKSSISNNYILPSYVVSLPIGGSYSFGFVSSVQNPTFQTISITRV